MNIKSIKTKTNWKEFTFLGRGCFVCEFFSNIFMDKKKLYGISWIHSRSICFFCCSLSLVMIPHFWIQFLLYKIFVICVDHFRIYQLLERWKRTIHIAPVQSHHGRDRAGAGIFKSSTHISTVLFYFIFCLSRFPSLPLNGCRMSLPSSTRHENTIFC